MNSTQIHSQNFPQYSLDFDQFKQLPLVHHLLYFFINTYASNLQIFARSTMRVSSEVSEKSKFFGR